MKRSFVEWRAATDFVDGELVARRRNRSPPPCDLAAPPASSHYHPTIVNTINQEPLVVDWTLFLRAQAYRTMTFLSFREQQRHRKAQAPVGAGHGLIRA